MNFNNLVKKERYDHSQYFVIKLYTLSSQRQRLWETLRHAVKFSYKGLAVGYCKLRQRIWVALGRQSFLTH